MQVADFDHGPIASADLSRRLTGAALAHPLVDHSSNLGIFRLLGFPTDTFLRGIEPRFIIWNMRLLRSRNVMFAAC